ncbi:hypothetical protein [Methylomonas sp. UP202]|uniref:hypothetical protein n=1 Tax=Methylomonas sp. UP202 TaxID=3040943 RepID=UPI002478EABF|nr:hypothetical protein [Methylomonas sp. UP202]WGS87628.1 hypothetical protein QC632_07670 [Methylomonas sp. UP202]
MTVINNVDFDVVVQSSIDATKAVITDNWDDIKDIVKNIADGLVNDVIFIHQKKASGEFNEDDSKIFLDDQKMLARIRLRSVAIIGLQLAERIWNAIAEVFRAAIKQAIGFTVL